MIRFLHVPHGGWQIMVPCRYRFPAGRNACITPMLHHTQFCGFIYQGIIMCAYAESLEPQIGHTCGVRRKLLN